MASEIEDAILKIFTREGRYGHTAITEKRLIRELSSELSVSEEFVRDQVGLSESVSSRTITGDSMLWSTNQSRLLERQATEQLERIIKSFSKKKRKEIRKSDLRLGKSVSLSKQQLTAVNAAITNGISIITGGPGTGKTTMVRALVFALKGLKLNVKLCAPTGKAAKRMGEATGLQSFKPETVHKFLERHGQAEHNSFDVMIVDEASMLDISLLHSLLACIPDGAQLVLIGDRDQLQPVNPGQPFRDLIKTIYNDLEVPIKTVSTETGVSGIVSAAYSVINGVNPESNLTLAKNDFEFIECDYEEITDTVIEYYFKKLPALFGKSFDRIAGELQILAPQRKGNSGLKRLNSEIQNKLTSSGELVFQGKGKEPRVFFAGDRVMQVKNDYELNVMNGEIGKIISKRKNSEGITVVIDGKKLLYDEEQIENLELAYAISIHKSQGSEYSGVIIPITSEAKFMLSRNLVYTAITRGKSKVCLIGEKRVFESTIENAYKGSRNTGLGLEIKQKELSKAISITRLTEIYRQKKPLDVN